MEIGEKTLKKGGELLTNSLLTYRKSINAAFLKVEGDELNITMGLKIKTGPGNGNFKLTSKIKFVTDQIEDTFSDSVDELQTNLFDGKPTRICPLRDGDEIIESVCGKCPSRCEGILVTGQAMPQVIPYGTTLPDLLEGEMVQSRSCSAWADEDYQDDVNHMVVVATQENEKRDGEKQAEGQVTEEPKEVKKTNSCGKEVFNGICSHLIQAKDGDGEEDDYESQCVEPKTLKNINCCRDCSEKGCNSRCANSELKAKKDKKKKAA
jgi:hypothetical protein